MIITVQDDFDLHKIAYSGQCFRVSSRENDTYRFITKEHVLYIKKVGEGAYDVSASNEEWDTIWCPYFDFQRNYANIRSHIHTQDSFMYKASEFGKGIRILRQDPWEMIITFIISQRKNIPAIKKAVEEISTAFGTKVKTPYEVIYAFPEATTLFEQMTHTNGQSLKLGYRLPYVEDAIKQVTTNPIVLDKIHRASTEEGRNILKNIHGIGNKVADCILLFAYGRTEIAPIDTWINKVIEINYNGLNPFPTYKDAAGIMQQYAFYYAIHQRNEY